jgi:hypothetical protein
MNKNDDMTVAVFEISNKVDNVESLLTGPPQHNMQNAEYLSLISDATLTICTLIGRRIMIEGYNEESVNDALSRFERLQTTYVCQLILCSIRLTDCLTDIIDRLGVI